LNQRCFYVNFASLLGQPEANFCVISAFGRRWHASLLSRNSARSHTVPKNLSGLTMPSHLFDDPKHWRKPAAQARTLAEQMSEPESKKMMLDIAKDYERLAERAEQRARKKES